MRVVYSPMDAVTLAQRDIPTARWCSSPSGFETTAPANAMAVVQATRLGLENFSVLVSHVLVPPAHARRCSTRRRTAVQGFLGRRSRLHGHGHREYGPIAEQYRVPIVVTGFEPWTSCRASSSA